MEHNLDPPATLGRVTDTQVLLQPVREPALHSRYDQEVACHNDLSPRNTVYRDLGAGLRPTAFIDWDIAAPGPRIHDVAHVCWQYIGLGLGPGAEVNRAGHLVGVIADAYGLVAARSALIETILWWQDRCWRGIDAAADAGEPAMLRLRDRGAVDDVRAAHEWTSQHRSTLERDPA